ncbi:hypothetical protein [Halocalculus aciditolerans]|uniref:Uncharacterized protein n=1 Tax=Halocalculus aciditolerans TaxID=1383812 RepID=A0A830FAN5_9EURY|nr:hypothetical protein [Halocalculus aciditolerans]GGL56157.1 hypothetical protein GCM10009039_12910 [Halocalculus aciditolerans]
MASSRRTAHPDDPENDDARPNPDATDSPTVYCREIHTDRAVFTEDGNGDGWIATDLTVTPEE